MDITGDQSSQLVTSSLGSQLVTSSLGNQLVTSSLGSQGLPATISPAASLPAPSNNQQTILPNPQGNVPSVAQAGDIMSVVSTTPSSGAQVAVPTQIKVRISYLYLNLYNNRQNCIKIKSN